MTKNCGSGPSLESAGGLLCYQTLPARNHFGLVPQTGINNKDTKILSIDDVLYILRIQAPYLNNICV